MKKILNLFIALILLVPAFGQKSKKDVVYLKTGAVIRGQLLTYDLATVKINSDGNLWVFQPSEVDSVSWNSKKVSRSSKSTDELGQKAQKRKGLCDFGKLQGS